MGCDIHLFTEKLVKTESNEQWVSTDKEEPAYDGRDYRLFAMLANVRNDSSNIPISKPKGIPDDCNSDIKQKVEHWRGDGHSHSYLTMGELYDYVSKNPTVKFSGLVDAEGADAIDKGEDPSWFCQGSTDPDMIYREWERKNETMNHLIQTLEEYFKSEGYVKSIHSEKFRIVFFFDN